MSNNLCFNHSAINLDLSETEKNAYRQVASNSNQFDSNLVSVAAYVPVKKVLKLLFEEFEKMGMPIEGRTIDLMFCRGIPELGIQFKDDKNLDKEIIQEIPWLTNVFREDAVVAAMNALLGVNSLYVPSEYRTNSFYEWKI